MSERAQHSGREPFVQSTIQKPRPPRFAAPERVLDPAFFRTAHDEYANVADAELAALARAGKLPPGCALNPTEFIQQVMAAKQLPLDFDPVGYRIHHPELWGDRRADWEIALHYVRVGRLEGAGWVRPFDANFYREVYLPGVSAADHGAIAGHRELHPDHYGSLEEALVRNGWRSRDWTRAFDYQAYIIYNTLTETMQTPAQALVHFIEQGWRDLLAISAEQEFDPAYWADLAGSTGSLPSHEAYRLWVENGLAHAVPVNERAALRGLGLTISRYPAGFDWQAYLEERPSAAARARSEGRTPSRWDALEHLIERGVLDQQFPLPIEPGALAGILLLAGDRFTLAQREQDASVCYERALLCPDPPARLLRHCADQATRQGRPARALELYRRVRAFEQPGFWTWCNGAQAALAIGAWDEAADWVLGGLAEHPRDTRLQDILLRIQHARYEHAVSRHIGALRAGRAATELGAELDGILDLFMQAHRVNFGETGVRMPPGGGPLRVVVLANKDLAQCTFYRVDAKLEQLGGAEGVELQVFERSDDAAFRSAAATADIAVFYRLASNVEVLRCIAACRAIGVPTVYEVDDLVFDSAAFPEPYEAYSAAISEEAHFGLRAGVGLVRHAVTACDAAIASTERLATHLRPLVRSGRAVVHRNGLSGALAALARASAPRPQLAQDPAVTLFYGSGTLAHGADFQDLLAPAIAKLMAEHAHVRFVACGHVEAGELAARFPGRVELVPPVADRDAYLSQLLSVDINLAVLRPGVFNDCKSEIKWLEAAAFCVPSVVSDVEGYRETLEDGTHVVRVKPHADAWHAALRALVRNPARRAAIGAAARDRAVALYAPETLGRALAAELRQLAGKTVPAAPRRPRVLLANVFFPPQAIGGATRVVRDQAAELLQRYADRYDIGILCGNDEDDAPYRTEAYAWRGAPVWSVGCPHREHMDWIAFDPDMAAPVDAVLDRFQPDLVHAHCIQRLSATALQRVAARGIPYVVTAHDAWWVSDHQFLTDKGNRLRMPWDAEEYETPYNPHRRTEAWSRRLKLRAVLDGAAAVLPVSETFAAIYRRAGIGRAAAVPNGLPDLPPLEPAPATPGRVRIAHLGGVMAHKGYYLLRQAIERGQFANLDLMVMDHALNAGEDRREVWGSTPVLITGRVPQSRAGALYGSFDVLCAPSLWPESFGLVAREALHYGRWVIASSLGAIGEDVVPGQNGWVVDVAQRGALGRILAEIDADPARFARPPKLRTPGRPVGQQVAEIVAVYDRVLHPAAPAGAQAGAADAAPAARRPAAKASRRALQ